MADDDAEVPATKKARTQAAQPLQLGLSLCAIGLGCLPAGVAYPQPARRPDAKAFQAIVQAAASAASPETLFVDTADTYCEPCNNTGELEHLLRGAGANVVVSTKAGMVSSHKC
jgi:aryl-alcohol dehydrogenase-like predicted oxidoreductase